MSDEHELPGLDEVPEVIQAWLRQLLDPHLLDILHKRPEQQIEIRLYANAGRVRKHPVIVLNSGPVEHSDPESL